MHLDYRNGSRDSLQVNIVRHSVLVSVVSQAGNQVTRGSLDNAILLTKINYN